MKMLNDFSANDTYKTLSLLGQCYQNIGTVQLAKHLPSGQMVAIKKLNLDRVREDVDLIEHEIILTRQLQHANIIKYLVSFVHGSELFVVSPLMGYGSCRDLLNVHFSEGLPEPAIALIMRDVLEALDYVHKRGIIHRAIRASHVLVSANGTSCLTGFRYSCPIIKNGKWQKQIHTFPSSTAKNLNWLSPEMLEQNLQGYNEKSDIYSVGILLCELANGAEPFAGTSTTLMLTEKVRGCAPQLLDSTTLSNNDTEVHGDVGLKAIFKKQAERKFSDGLHEIGALCLQHDADDRPSGGQLLSHSYFRQHRRHQNLAEYLKPAIPISDNVAYNSDEMECYNSLQKMSELELFSCEWDF